MTQSSSSNRLAVLLFGAAVLLGLTGQIQAGKQRAGSNVAPAGFNLSATTDNLQHLVTTGGSLTIGDKIFSNFDFFASGLTSFDPSQIRVTASVSGGVYYLGWAGNMSLVSGGPATGDLVLNYTVTATAGVIDMIDQFYTGSAQPLGSAFIAVDETVRNTQGIIVANSHLQVGDLSDPFAEPGDNLNVNPGQSVLHVTKDITFGVVDGGFVTISDVRQSFHQVPEAATTALLGLGMAFFGATAYRRKRKA